ncbi:hypothetical protein L1987_14033 [Smallanthus sonchifolius]|uniref:Uncharacterized protein n=1 Tax=Smallanthus sonchifolius TaxID=185202 RepID=A0ACB9JKV9_9ASTR|nr:hypothetical protein L1987_14033 [Smallanthus sonchifolius]
MDIMYQNHNTTDPSYLDLLSGKIGSNSQNLSTVENHQELSLSLGMQIASSMDLPSFQYNYLNPHLQDSGDQSSQSNELDNVDFLTFSRPMSSVVPRIYNSGYLKPTQELLEEVANVDEGMRQLKANKHNNVHKFDEYSSRIESSAKISVSEKKELQNKVTKLYSLLDETAITSTTHRDFNLIFREGETVTYGLEQLMSALAELLGRGSIGTTYKAVMDNQVDIKYREYCQQLRTVEGSLDMVTGCGATRSYTTLAHHTISRHFCCLRDEIHARLQVTRQDLGEQDDSSDTVLPRLRNVEKQLRQQRTENPFGVIRHSWRPQKGLPEGSLSILRAWLFKHFLNPYAFFDVFYPKNLEKIMLARKTGLTRSQIANWFINARVRLWKPMVEDMYKEEFRDRSSSSEDKADELRKNSSLDFVNDMEVNGYVEQRHVDLAD